MSKEEVMRERLLAAKAEWEADQERADGSRLRLDLAVLDASRERFPQVWIAGVLEWSRQRVNGIVKG